MIQAMAKRITSYMDELGVLSESVEIHRYGIEVIISTIINVLFIMILSLISHKYMDGIIYILGFYYIRKFSGGYHCDTYFKCISLYVTLFLVYLLTYSIYDMIARYIIVFAFIVFILYVPVHNRNLSIREHKIYKIISFINLIIFIILSNISYYSSIFSYLLLVVSILIIAGIKKYEIQSI